jgi:polar amino acid transport system substrate-binding protein
MKQRPGVFERVDPAIPGDPAYQFWVTRPEDLDLRDFINSVIRKLRDNGELAELQRKWFGVKMNLPDGGYLPPGAF